MLKIKFGMAFVSRRSFACQKDKNGADVFRFVEGLWLCHVSTPFVVLVK